jgi:ribosomal protein L34
MDIIILLYKEKDMEWILPNRLIFSKWVYKNFRQPKQKSDFDADPSQKFIADFLNYNSPYRGILVYHGLGTGKTCTSILASESFVSKKKNVIVLLPASLEKNYRKELGKCSRTGSLLRGKWNLLNLSMRDDMEVIDMLAKELSLERQFIEDRKGLVWVPVFIKVSEDVILEKEVPYKKMEPITQKSVLETYEYIIDKRYTFLHYNGLTNKHLDKCAKLFEKDAIVIIDEVHAFISRVVNGGKIARRLYNILIGNPELRIVLLSGTPVINHPFELAYTLNLLRGSMTEYCISTLKDTPLPTLEELKTILEKEKLYQYIDTIDVNGTQACMTLLPNGFIRKSKDGIEVIRGPYHGESFMNKVVNVLKKPYNLSSKVKINEYTAFPDKKEVFIEYFFDTTDPQAPVVKKENQEMFMRRLQGIVSYYRISDESMFPMALEPIYKKIPMSNQQFSYYAERRTEEVKQEDRKTKKETQMRKKGTQVDLFQTNTSYKAYSRMACNFVFPQEIQRPFPKDIRMKILRKEIDIQDDDNEEEEEEKTKPNETKLYDAEIKKALDALNENHLSGKGLYECSPKMYTLLEDLTRNTKMKSLLYTQFRTVEGLRIFRMVLQYANWIEIDFRPLGNNDWEIINAETVLQPEYNYKRFLVFGTKEKTDILISLYNADIKNLPKTIQKQLSKYNHSTNLYGEIASLLMITQSGAEGLNLRNVRYVYILEPFWNQVRIDQVIGRAIRKGSHLELPENERNVQVIMYISTFTQKQTTLNKTIKLRDDGRTTDEDILSIATRKNKIISQFLTMIKANAVDCIFHAPQNKPSDYKCYMPPINEDLHKIAYNPNIEKTTKTFGLKERLKKVKGRSVLVNKEKYVVLDDDKTLYDYNAYKYAGVLVESDEKPLN